MTPENRRAACLPSERAFVVQFYADPGLDTAHLAGRVEHVVSGQVGHVHSLATLLSFIADVLGVAETGGAAEA